jgi:hypothetical protein
MVGAAGRTVDCIEVFLGFDIPEYLLCHGRPRTVLNLVLTEFEKPDGKNLTLLRF